jgi:hypothetical protein
VWCAVAKLMVRASAGSLSTSARSNLVVTMISPIWDRRIRPVLGARPETIIDEQPKPNGEKFSTLELKPPSAPCPAARPVPGSGNCQDKSCLDNIICIYGFSCADMCWPSAE